MSNNCHPFSFKIIGKGCFQVTSHRPNNKGYPTLVINGISIYAHRYIWEKTFGPIPKGICVLHHCDNPACVNPEHLFLGTKADNNHDRNAKGRQARGEQSGRAKLTAISVQKIRLRYLPYDRKNGIRALAREFGVSHSAIQYAIKEINWGWLK